MSTIPPKPVAPAAASRNRLQLDLAEPVALLLDHVSNVLGLQKSQVVVQALLQALPGLVDQADQVRKRSRELSQAAQKK